MPATWKILTENENLICWQHKTTEKIIQNRCSLFWKKMLNFLSWLWLVSHMMAGFDWKVSQWQIIWSEDSLNKNFCLRHVAPKFLCHFSTKQTKTSHLSTVTCRTFATSRSVRDKSVLYWCRSRQVPSHKARRSDDRPSSRPKTLPLPRFTQ